MTAKQLLLDVRAMGFDRLPSEGEADTMSVFLSAANRAQETLAAHFPLTLVLTLHHLPPSAKLVKPRLSLAAGETQSEEAGGVAAYSFEASGAGEVLVYRDGALFARHTLTEKPTLFYAAFPALSDCRILMQATEATLITSLMLLADKCREGVRVRHSETEYDLSILVDESATLAESPVTSDGIPLREGVDYRVCNHSLILANSVSPQLSLTLRRMPKRLTLDCEVPDVRADAMHLLPLLTSAYVWLDSDREKALFYLSMYRDSLARALSNGRYAPNARYTGNGW